MAEASPNHVYIELDIAWVVYGGGDPVEFINRHPGRFPAIHVKGITDLDERAKLPSGRASRTSREASRPAWPTAPSGSWSNRTHATTSRRSSVAAGYLNGRRWGSRDGADVS
jgi:hypothetical protein